MHIFFAVDAYRLWLSKQHSTAKKLPKSRFDCPFSDIQCSLNKNFFFLINTYKTEINIEFKINSAKNNLIKIEKVDQNKNYLYKKTEKYVCAEDVWDLMEKNKVLAAKNSEIGGN